MTSRPRISRSRLSSYYEKLLKRSIQYVTEAFPVFSQVCVKTHTDSTSEPEVVSVLQIVMNQIDDIIKEGTVQGVDFKQLLVEYVKELPEEDKFLQIKDDTGRVPTSMGGGYNSKIPHKDYTFRIETEDGRLVSARFVAAKDFLPEKCTAVFGVNRNGSNQQLIGNLAMALTDGVTDFLVGSDVFLRIFAFTEECVEVSPKMISAEFVKTHKDWRHELKLKPTFTASDEIPAVTFKTQVTDTHELQLPSISNDMCVSARTACMACFNSPLF